MIVAVHQPNYLPWLGYFAKIATADALVFLDDVQYPKGSFTNRVRIMGRGGPRWLSVPVSARLGERIDAVHPAVPDWPSRHMDTLHGQYRDAPAFAGVWPALREMLGECVGKGLADANASLVQAIAGRLGLECRFERSSSYAGAGAADDRLVELVAALDPQGTYLSGAGARKYQDPDKFAAAGLGFRYLGFEHPAYDQGSGAGFHAGLSVVDALLHLGWQRTGALLGT